MADVTPIVSVADEDVSVRESLQRMIRCEGRQPRAFASVEEFFARPPALAPNCLILDVSLAGLDGLSVQRRIAIERPEMPIIFITGTRTQRTEASFLRGCVAAFTASIFIS
jgi:FixJ family two-component response regulator